MGFSVVPPCLDGGMQVKAYEEAIAWLEKGNADLEPELLDAGSARELLALCARGEKLFAYAKTALARRVDDATEVARASGTSVGKAKVVVETAKALRDSDVLNDALAGGDVSVDQASEIVKAERAKPGSADELIRIAKHESFLVLKEKSRRVVLESEQQRGLTERQRDERGARSYSDDLGMLNIHLRMTPGIGTAITNRAEAEARRLQREAKAEGRSEPFERHLCDAYGAMLSGAGTKAKPRRPELVVLVSYEVIQRGWKDVREGESCKIPGVGPVSPEFAKEIAADAFLTGLFYDGKDLRNIKSWTREKPAELLRALQLGSPPDFDGIKCADCGNRFRNEDDHVEPHCGGNPTSLDNLQPRCYSCHKAKTDRDRKAGKLRSTVGRGPPN